MVRRRFIALLAAVASITTMSPALAADAIKLGVFKVNASLPYYVALKRGYFQEVGLEPETVQLGTPMR